MATEAEGEIALDRLFAAGRGGPVPSEALAERMMADATAQIRPPASRRQRARGGLGAVILGLLGGWPGMAGLSAAAAAGVWIGFSSPDLVDGYLGSDGYGVSDFMPDFASLAAGG